MGQFKSSEASITLLLDAWKNGDREALNQIVVLVYQDLRNMAHYYLKGGGAHKTLQPTALVHEVYQRLLGATGLALENRDHFFNCACLIMRQILGRYAKRNRGKTVSVGEMDGEHPFEVFGGPDPETLLALDEALGQLKTMDPRRHQIIELRFYLGLSDGQISQVLDVSTRTIRRESLTAKRWLARALRTSASER